MTRLRAWAPWLLIGWTIILWLSRLRNVLADDDLTTSGRAVRVGIVATFVLLAVVAATAFRQANPVGMILLIVWTVGYWMVRGTGILIGDWSAGFKVVHTVLMMVSIGLAGFGWSVLARR